MILGRLKLWISAAMVALTAVLGALAVGRKAGRKAAEEERAVEAARSQKDIADFHRTLGELNAENDAPRNRDDLVDRLRGDGL